MLAQKLKDKIESTSFEKQSNLIISLDLRNPQDILNFVRTYGHKILGIKLHSDIIIYEKVSREGFLYNLLLLKEQHNLILIEDRKFCDIGNTVHLQSRDITQYADLVTVHAISGPGVIDGLRTNCLNNNCGILLISQMSTMSNLISESYTDSVKQFAATNSDIVVGFICQERMGFADGHFLHFAPGLKLVKDPTFIEPLGQGYKTPLDLYQKGIDFFIVGRDIYEADQPEFQIDLYNGVYKELNMLKKRIVQAGVIKTGDFVLSSGEQSTVYADFRLLNGNPKLLKLVAKEISRRILEELHGSCESLVLMGVPLGGISLATAVSLESGIPMVVVRDKRKEYGSKNLIEGMTKEELKSKKIVLIEDVITTGGSVERIINRIKTEEDLEIHYVFCILDRCKGGDVYIQETYKIPVRQLFSTNFF